MLQLNESLLFTVLNYGEGEHFVSIARSQGAMGGTIFPVKGTAESSILRVLGLGDTTRDAVMIVLGDETAEKVISAAQEDSKIHGVSALLATDEEIDMNHGWKMITVIVNSGFADDIMDTARKAGAQGGTVTHARGTAPNNEESRFMDMTVVPEKEMIMIVTPSDKTESIVKAIKEMPCLNQPGIGVVFTQPVKKFVNLGNKK